MRESLCLPEAKRVRWDDSVLSDRGPHRPDIEDSRSPPVKAEEAWCEANDAIRLVNVLSVAQLCDEEDGCRPPFTHQFFDDEKITGYTEGSVTIRVVYVATSLDVLVEIKTSDDDPTRKATILTRLSRALPPQGFSTDRSYFGGRIGQAQKEFKPPGRRVHEYERSTKSFAVYRATGEDPGACDYHDKAQSLAPWFIEQADPIDLTDDRWEIFYMFEEDTAREVLSEKWRPSALAGYFTVFGFRNPVKGVSLRICQALVLPGYQRQGHGQVMLAYLYQLARERESVFEITVEDPSPGFQKLRNMVDARALLEHKAFPDDLLSAKDFQRPTKDVIESAHKALKLTMSQVEIGFDVLKARGVAGPVGGNGPAGAEIGDATASDTGASDAGTGDGVPGEPAGEDETRKRFRLMVKRRLLKRHGGELSSDAATRKRQLDELYRDIEQDLLSLGAKIRTGDQ